MRTILKIEPRSKDRTLIDMAYTMVENGLVPRSKEYHGDRSTKSSVVTEN